MIIALTGVTGFIGQHLIQQLDKKDLKIFLLGKNPLNPIITTLTKNKEISFVNYDLVEGNKNISNTLKHVDVLLHLAAFVPRSNQPEDEDINKTINSNITGTFNLLRDFSPITKKIVYISTLEVYGKPITFPICESHPTDPLTYYGTSKLTAEKLVSIFSNQHGFKSTILRLSTVYGPGESYNRAVPNFIKRVNNNQSPIIYGDGSDIRDYIHVDDVVKALVNTMQNNHNGIYNIASGKGITIREISEKIIQIYGKHLKPLFKPSKSVPTNIILDISKAIKEMHFTPTVSIDDGLDTEISWYKSVSNN